jgi:hypothetical protein
MKNIAQRFISHFRSDTHHRCVWHCLPRLGRGCPRKRAPPGAGRALAAKTEVKFLSKITHQFSCFRNTEAALEETKCVQQAMAADLRASQAREQLLEAENAAYRRRFDDAGQLIKVAHIFLSKSLFWAF